MNSEYQETIIPKSDNINIMENDSLCTELEKLSLDILEAINNNDLDLEALQAERKTK